MTPPDPWHLSGLVAAELDEPRPETNENRVTEPTRDLFGLSLSGGGIRSATFNLGLLQGLHHFRLLGRLDYLSTVSGGGYIGSFWSAWRSRSKNTGKTFPDASGAGHRGEAAEVRHLREFSNFLVPRLGVLSWDTGRILVSMLSSAVPSLLTSLSVIALGVLGWLAGAYGILATNPVFSTVAFVGVTAVLLIVAELMWRRRGEENDRLAYAEAAIWGLVSTGFVWGLIRIALDGNGPDWYQTGQTLPIDPGGSTPLEWQLYLMAPVAAWGTVIMAFALRRWLTSTGVQAHRGRVSRNSFDRVNARLILLVAIWIVVTGLWIAGVELWEYAQAGREVGVAAGTGGAIGAILWAFVDLQKRLSAKLSAGSRPSVLARLRPFAPQLLAYAAIALMVVGVVVLLVAFEQSDVTFLRPTPVWFGALAATIVIVTLARLNANEVGLHTFYRARLSRAYLGASNPDGDARGMTEERKDDDIKLDALTAEGPCHLICCAANDLANRELGNLHRGARSAVLSRAGFTVDERVRRWTKEAPAPTVSAAVTASAAAFNTLMGGKSMELGPAVTFLMAALNLRLGLWLPLVTEPGLRGTVEHRFLHGLPFFKEMFGIASAEGRHVHLSDGGHFENMALYELIRRHCRFIIASDCGMDPTISFDDIGNLVRRVRSDFGVDIRIDLEPLRPNENGFARQSMVAGDIHYPEGDTGVLLLFKPALTGTEPADVAQYQKRNPAFPHESTVDQFYNEAQWESYRRLGEHAALDAFVRIAADLDTKAADYPGRLFGRARREGQPVPAGFGDRLSHFADRIAELDTMLRKPDCVTLLREVYKEFDAIDRNGAGPSVRASSTVGEGRREAQGSSGEVAPRLPAPADLAPSLHLIRRVLLLMQELYTRDRLEENYNHPLYLGTINYFARWTSAPLFRMWWPILKTMYPQPFTRFVERVYGLRVKGGDGYSVVGTVGDSARSIEGFAMTCWMQEGRHELAEGQHFLPFTMPLTYHGVEHHLQAAQILLDRVGTDLVWDSHDFYVPPGLWGAGIGESFLGRLLERVGPGCDTTRLFVRIAASAETEHAARKQIANERQLYHGAGFTRIGDHAVPEEVLARMKTIDGVRQAAEGPDSVQRWMAHAPPEVGNGTKAGREVAIATGVGSDV